MIIKAYNSTQNELYAVARSGWHSYAQFLAQFTAYRGYYLAPYGIAALAEIDAAEALPDAQARYGESEALRALLVLQGDACLGRWQTLKRYATTSFPPVTLKARLETAGAMRYEKAANYNWEELRGLNVSAEYFMTTYDAQLSAGNNMPATFPTDYAADIAEFNSQYEAFISSEAAAYNATEAKIAANNAVHAKLMSMFKDGQEIFMDIEGKRREFTFDTVLGLISSAGQAGIRGLATSSLDSQPVSIFEVMILETSATAAGEQDGRYLLKPVASGTYTVRVTAPGYRTKVVHNVVISVGVISTLDIELDPE